MAFEHHFFPYYGIWISLPVVKYTVYWHPITLHWLVLCDSISLSVQPKRNISAIYGARGLLCIPQNTFVDLGRSSNHVVFDIQYVKTYCRTVTKNPIELKTYIQYIVTNWEWHVGCCHIRLLCLFVFPLIARFFNIMCMRVVKRVSLVTNAGSF